MALTFFDLDQIKTLAAESPELYGGLYELSPATNLLMSAALLDTQERWRWRASGSKLDDTQWDEAQAMVDQAVYELDKEPVVPVEVPVWVQAGTVISSQNNVTVVQPLSEGGDHYMFVYINHDSVDYVDTTRYKISVEPDGDYVQPPGSGVHIYDRSDVELSIEQPPLLDYCNNQMGYFVIYSFVQTFLVTLTVKEACP